MPARMEVRAPAFPTEMTCMLWLVDACSQWCGDVPRDNVHWSYCADMGTVQAKSGGKVFGRVLFPRCIYYGEINGLPVELVTGFIHFEAAKHATCFDIRAGSD